MIRRGVGASINCVVAFAVLYTGAAMYWFPGIFQANVKLSGSPQALADAQRPVAIVPLGNGRYITANYSHLSIVDLNRARVTTMAVEWKTTPGTFVPTGLAYDPISRELFIANYIGNNILQGEVDGADHKVAILGVIGKGAVVSPEGVSFDRQRQLLASAQYDGNSVTLFQRSVGLWQLKCMVAVPQAHGIALSGRYMFATSLANRELLKINIETCAVEARTGSLGWDASAGQFMWPVAVQLLSNGMIAVSDAHTGHVSIVDPDTMAVHAVFGDNRPGFGGLNMPYGFAEANRGKVIVLSTIGSRMIEFEGDGRPIRSYSLADIWRDDDAVPDDVALGPPSWENYIEIDPTVTLLDECFFGGYAQLVSCTGKKNWILPRPEDDIFSGGGYFYFSKVAQTGDGIVIVSPQNAVALYIAATEDAILLIPTWVGLDSWMDRDRVRRPPGDLSIAVLAAESENRALALARLIRTAHGLQVGEIASSLMGSTFDPGTPATASPQQAMAAVEKILAHFADPVGRRFVAESGECEQHGCAEETWCDVAQSMAESFGREATIDLVRLSVASEMNNCVLRSYRALMARSDQSTSVQ
jgi:hypothetical protein